MKPGPAHAEVIEVLDRFCAGFADRDAEGVMRLVAPDQDVMVVTSEPPMLRGAAELERFLERYVAGRTTYSWIWDRCDATTLGAVAWLLAEGIETAATADHVEHHPYRMTMVLERRAGRWVIRQVHGSSPH